MSKEHTGGPAFPQPITDYRQYEGHKFTGFVANDDALAGGMTLRDYFAGQAVGALITRMALIDIATQTRVSPNTRDEMVTFAYGLADAMLAEREK